MRFVEEHQIVAGFIPVDTQAAANDGDWVSLKNYRHVTVIVYKAVGTAGDDPVLTMEQASAVAGTGAKALTFTTVHTKQGADLAAVGVFTKVTQAAAATYTDATSAELAAIWVVEFDAEELDVNGGFDCVRARVADVGGAAQLGCLLYILSGPRYPQALNASAIVN